MKYPLKNRKIAIFADQNNFKFMNNIIPFLRSRNNLKIFNAYKKNDIEEAARWADIVYIEWTENLVKIFSSFPKRFRLVCRLHSYEAYSPYLYEINWRNIDSIIFISSQIKNYVEQKLPYLSLSTDVYTISEGVDLDKFYFKERSHGFNIAFVGYLIQTKNISLLLQAFKLLHNINSNYKLHLFGKYTNDSGVSPEIPKRYLEHQVKSLSLENDIIFYNEIPQNELVSKLDNMNYLISTSYREGLPFNILEGMAMGIKPLIHNWPGANELFPKSLLFDYIGDIPELINGEYNSKVYRKFVSDNHNLKFSLLEIENVILGKKEKEDKTLLKINNKKLKILYLAIASPTYPQVLEKIDYQIREMKKYNPNSEGLVIGFGKLSSNSYQFNYINILDFKFYNFLEKTFSLMEDFTEEFIPDIIYFRYPGASSHLNKFTEKFPNIVFEHQTKELEEYKKQKDNEFYSNELKYGKCVLNKVLGVTTITTEVARYELERADKNLDYFVFGNGVAHSYPEEVSVIQNDIDTVHILFAGHFSEWHGFDRIIKGLISYNEDHKVIFHVAGDGEKRDEYINMINNNKLQEYFNFYGFLEKAKLWELASKCDIAIGSLALHRIDFSEVAPLKHREYCYQGLPFVFSGRDVDFSEDLPFILRVDASDEPIDINNLLEFAKSVKNNVKIKKEAHKYAKENLLWEIKTKKIIEFLEKIYNKNKILIKESNSKNEIISSLISVIIPCYNHAHYLEEAVESVIKQSYPNWEIIIVNDGSTDKTIKKSNILINRYPNRKISLISQKNKGLSAARNIGIKKSRGKYFLPLDADDKISENFLSKTLSSIKRNPDIGFVYSNIQHFGDRNDVYNLPEFDRVTLVGKDNIVSVCSLVRKKVWEENFGYNENMKDGYEDWDFWISAAELGWNGYRIKEPLFFYRKSNSSMLHRANEKRDRLFAQIIFNHPNLYPESYKKWASKILIEKYSLFQSKLRITFLINNILGVTGGNQTLLKLTNMLVERGYDVNIITYSEKPQWINIFSTVITIPSNNSMHKYIPPSDVVVSTYFMNTFELLKVDAKLKIYYAQGDQYVFEQDIESSTREVSVVIKKMKELSKQSYLYNNIIFIPNSYNLAKKVEEIFGRTAEAILPVGYDEDVYYPDDTISNHKDIFNILVIGPDNRGSIIEPLDFKGIADIRKGLDMIDDDKYKFNVIRISNTEKEIFKDFPCDYYITPEKNTKHYLYAKSDILIYASHYDSSPLPPLEGMASKVAVICTATDGAKEYCKNEINSLLIPIKSPKAIAEAIQKLIDDTELRNKLILNGLNTAKGLKFTQLVDNFEKIINTKVIDKDKDINYHLKKIRILLKEAKFLEASFLIKKLINERYKYLQPSLKDQILSMAGNIALLNNSVEEAKIYFEKALEENPQSSKACAGLGKIFLKEEEIKSAKIMYEWAVKNDPENKSAKRDLEKINKTLELPANHNSLENDQPEKEKITFNKN